MATERLILEINEKGARVVKRNIEGVSRGSREAEGSVQLLRRALGLIGGALVIRQIVQLADQFTNLQNRLRVVTRDQQNLNAVTGELLRISNSTRSSLASNAELFSRLSLSTRELGLSQRDLLEFTESLNQAITLSGASAIEAQAGIIQLSQGLASGALRGDELRSVLEQLPVIADVIAKQLNVTRGELQQLGSEGKITADIIVDAFRSAQDALAQDFAKTVPTLSQAFQVAQNNLLVFVGGIDKAIGASQALADVIIVASQHLDIFAKAAAIAGTILLTIFVRQGVVAAIRAVKALTLALLANPFSALLVGITATIVALALFSDRLRFFTNVVTRTIDALVDDFLVGLKTIRTAWEFLPELLADIGIRSANALIDFVEAGINKVVGLINNLETLTGFGLDPVTLTRLENEYTDAGVRFREALFQGLQEREPFQFFNEQANNVLDKFDELSLKFKQFQLPGATGGDGAGGDAGLDVRGQRVDVRAAQRDRELAEILRKLRREGELLALNNRERQIQNDLFRVEEQLRAKNLELGERATDVEAILRQNQAIRERQELLEQIRGGQADAARQIQILNDLFKDGAITLDQFNTQFRILREQELQTASGFGAGFERALINFQGNIVTTADLVQSQFQVAFRGASDALVGFVETGKFSFRDFFGDISKQLLRLSTQQLVGQLVGGIGGGIGGGGGGGLAGGLGGIISNLVQGFQSGGSFQVNSRSAANLGAGAGTDNRLVAFRGRDGERVTVSPPGQQGERPVNVMMTINTPDAESFRRSQGQIESRISASLQRANRRDN